jgi:uncharacterized protein with FMN-binding domain
MRKGIVAILAVAIIGALGIYSNGHKTHANTAVQAANTNTAAAPAAANTAQSSGSTSSNSASSTGAYKDGTYTGTAENNIYGTVQVAAVISGGKITDIQFLQMPGPEGHSKEVTAFSESPLKQSALNKQSAHIDFVSGATQTSESYELSLQAALDKAA